MSLVQIPTGTDLATGLFDKRVWEEEGEEKGGEKQEPGPTKGRGEENKRRALVVAYSESCPACKDYIGDGGPVQDFVRSGGKVFLIKASELGDLEDVVSPEYLPATFALRGSLFSSAVMYGCRPCEEMQRFLSLAPLLSADSVGDKPVPHLKKE